MKAFALLLLASSLATAVCPTWVGRPEPYSVGSILTLEGKNYKVQRTLDNGWIHPTDTWFWAPTTEVCPQPPAPPPVSPPVPAPSPSTLYATGGAIYASIEGIPGSVNWFGFEGTVEVQQLTHRVYMPTDRDDGSITGTRKHDGLVIRKRMDKSSPLLFKKVCTGETIPRIEFKYIGRNDMGESKAYRSIILYRVKVADFRLLNTEAHGWTEDVTFRYERISFVHYEGNIQHTDEWNTR